MRTVLLNKLAEIVHGGNAINQFHTSLKHDLVLVLISLIWLRYANVKLQYYSINKDFQ